MCFDVCAHWSQQIRKSNEGTDAVLELNCIEKLTENVILLLWPLLDVDIMFGATQTFGHIV